MGTVRGKEGASGAVRIRKNGEDRWQTFSEAYGTASPNKFADIQVQAGDEIRIVSPEAVGMVPLKRENRARFWRTSVKA